jgi:hypothetical protein
VGPALDQARAEVFGAARAALEGGLGGALELYSGAGLARRPLNNATVVAGRIYRTRLELFEALFQQAGGVRAAIEQLKVAVEEEGDADPYEVLEGLVGR